MKAVTLKAKLMFFLLGVVVVSNGILGFLAYSMIKPALEDSVEQTITSVSEDVAVQIKKENEREFHVLNILANLDVISDPELSTVEKNKFIQGAAKTSSRYENIAYYGSDGLTITDDGRAINFSDREYFKKAMSGNQYVSDPAISSVNGKLLMFYSVPVHEKKIKQDNRRTLCSS